VTAETILQAGAVIDGTGRPPLRDAVVHVRRGVIAFVGPAAEAPPAPPDAVVHDLGDRVLLPGLVDCHAHPVPWRGLAAIAGDDTPELQVLYGAKLLREALLSGVTTFRDCGAPGTAAFALKTAVRNEYIPGPRLVVAGPPMCPSGGHGHDAGGAADGVDGVRRKARLIFRDGADFIKVTATGGGTPGTLRHRATFTVEELRSAAAEAEQHDSYVTAHCHATEGIVRCLDAGVTMLEHATFVGPDGLEHLDMDIVHRIRDLGVTVSPTVAIHGRWLEDVTDWVGDMDPAEYALWKRRSEGLERRLEIVGALHEAGVRVLIGSDGGVGRNYPAALDDLAYSVELHTRAGVSPHDAIRQATSIAAEAIGLGSVVGRLAAGFEADIIAVDGDPLERIQALGDVSFVMARGRVVRTP
jgi:imidazolonepropionase-like amidohydrolase